MALVSDLDLPTFDYTDAELHGPRFHAAMAELRAQGWLAATPLGYVVLERDAAGFFLRTRKAEFPGMKIAELFGVEEGPLYEEMRRNILHLNGADHARLRGLVNPSFTPRAAERWRPAMRGFLERLIAELDTGQLEVSCEFVSALAKPYPSLTIAMVLGAPLADAPRLHDWSNWIQRQFDAPTLMAERPRIERAVTELYAYLDELLAARRAAPGEDLISQLIAAEEQGDRLSDVELLNLVLNVLIGGIDTTQSQLAHAMRLLAEHPEQWDALRADPELTRTAVEETLRYEPITPFTARILTEEVEYRGVSFPSETILLICAFTANRDGVSESPGFDITAARDVGKPLTFGAGIHYCLGANLARAELQEALGLLAERVRSVKLDGEPVYEGVQGVYGMSSLPLRLEFAR
jgi:cytochrome P450